MSGPGDGGNAQAFLRGSKIATSTKIEIRRAPEEATPCVGGFPSLRRGVFFFRSVGPGGPEDLSRTCFSSGVVFATVLGAVEGPRRPKAARNLPS